MKKWEFESICKGSLENLACHMNNLGQHGYHCVGWQQTKNLTTGNLFYEAVMAREIPEQPATSNPEMHDLVSMAEHHQI